MISTNLRRVVGALLLAGGIASAQPHNQDLIATTGGLFRVGMQGAVTTIGFPGTLGNVTFDADGRLAVGVDSWGWILQIDPASGVSTSIGGVQWGLYGGGSAGIDLDQDGDYLALTYAFGPCCTVPRPIFTQLLRVDRNTGSRTQVSAYGPVGGGFLPNAMVADKTTGNRFLTGVHFALGPKSNLAILGGPGGWCCVPGFRGVTLGDLTQDPHTSDIYVLGSNTVMRLDPATTQATTITTGIQGTAIVADRGVAPDGTLLFVGDSSGVIHRVARDGTVLGALAKLPAAPRDLAFLSSRNVASVRVIAPNDRKIRIDFLDQPGRAYVCAMSLSGYTNGPRLPDGRVIPLRIDALTRATASGSLPYLTGNVGVLDSAGRAVARFDANPPGTAVRGMRVWCAAITIDPTAPSGVGRVSHPILIVL